MAATCLVASQASASGFSVARFGGEHGTPMTTNGTSLYYNPGGFAASEGNHVMVDVSLAWRSAKYQHTERPGQDCFSNPDPGAGCSDLNADDTALAKDANTSEGTLFNIIAAPTLFFTTKLGDLGLAVGFFTPFGGQASWDKNSDYEGHDRYQGIEDGGQRWYTIDGVLRTSFLSAGIGYHLKDAGLSFGVSGNLLITTIKTLRARVAGTSNDDIASEGRSVLDVKGTDWSFGAGIRFTPGDGNTAIGLSYQSAPNFDGKMEVDGTLTNIYGAGDAPGGSASDVTLHQALPHVFRAGVESKLGEKWAMRLFGDYQTWSVLEGHCVTDIGEECDVASNGSDQDGKGIIVNQPRNWKDTFGLRLGASYFTSDTVELMAGIGFASNAIPDDTLEPALMDFDALTPTIGARLGLGDSVKLGVVYTQVVYFSRDTSGQSKAFEKPFPSQGPDAGGKYSQSIGVLNVNADFQF